jgi:hypothetical protein
MVTPTSIGLRAIPNRPERRPTPRPFAAQASAPERQPAPAPFGARASTLERHANEVEKREPEPLGSEPSASVIRMREPAEPPMFARVFESQEPAPPAPSVRVTIGRIEVRAVLPPAPVAPQNRSSRPALTLEEYTKQRNRRER